MFWDRVASCLINLVSDVPIPQRLWSAWIWVWPPRLAALRAPSPPSSSCLGVSSLTSPSLRIHFNSCFNLSHLVECLSLGLIPFYKAISKLHLTFSWSPRFCCRSWKSGVERTICLAPPPPRLNSCSGVHPLLVSATFSNLEGNWLWVSWAL